jgi:hypothetical protein
MDGPSPGRWVRCRLGDSLAARIPLLLRTQHILYEPLPPVAAIVVATTMEPPIRLYPFLLREHCLGVCSPI